MSAMPDNIVPFQLPKKPRIREKEAPPDQRKVCVLPFRAVADQNLTDGGLRVLSAICSYCNRAGITWVSQAKLAADLGCSRQSITNQLAQLRRLGYVEVVSKSFKGIKPNTIRVIFDPTIKAEEAIAMVSATEDARPPEMRRKQEQAMHEPVDKEGQKRIAQMLAKALKNPNPKKEYTMPKSGQTMAVKAVKEANQKALKKRGQAVDNNSPIGHSSVANEEALHRQPIGHATMSHNTENIGIDKVKVKIIKDHKVVLGNLNEEQKAELIEAGLNENEIAEGLENLLAAYRAEGVTPTPAALMAGILQLHRDTNRA